jgi:1,4-alpha-glucan branching enzyme
MSHSIESPASVPPVRPLLMNNKPNYRDSHSNPSSLPAGSSDSTDSIFSDLDLHLFNEGNHFQIYECLGAHPKIRNGVAGTNFAVWAPNARAVSVVGNFNGWEAGRHSLHPVKSSGIWERFVPGVGTGELYKFMVTGFHGHRVMKSDPFGFASELPPLSASIVADLENYNWQDQDWLEQRSKFQPDRSPLSIYELHLGSWKQDKQRQNGWMNYRQLAPQVVEYCQQMGFTHVELLPISEHPFTGSWGYQTVGYFAVTSRYGTPADFMFFVDYCHQHGIGVIVDWVPAHFPKDSHGLAQFDGTALYEHADPRKGEHPDWNTLIFNYERNEVQSFLVSNALFWLKKYHIDGLRVDAVASMLYLDYSRSEGQWIPNRYGGRENLGAIDFLKKMNRQVHLDVPGAMTIAEESTAWPGVSSPVENGGLGFSLKWNMGWMNDTLRYFRKDPIYRSFHHHELTFSLVYAFSENFALPFSHDEVVHGKGSLLDQMPGDNWQKFANLRLLYSYMWTHPGKKLMFMGCEWGQWLEWNCDSELQWQLLNENFHQGVQRLVADLNQLYRSHPSLHLSDFSQDGFEWIDCHNHQDSILAYLRKGDLENQPTNQPTNQPLIVCANLTPKVHRNYRLGVPALGQYQELLNSDSVYYGGTNVGNGLGVRADKIPHHDRPCSISLTLPPLAVVVLQKADAGPDKLT